MLPSAHAADVVLPTSVDVPGMFAMARIFAVAAVPTAAVFLTFLASPQLLVCLMLFASLLLPASLLLFRFQLHRSWRTCSCWTPDVPVYFLVQHSALLLLFFFLLLPSSSCCSYRVLDLAAASNAVDVLYPSGDFVIPAQAEVLTNQIFLSHRTGILLQLQAP
jgi:hypothetical protein